MDWTESAKRFAILQLCHDTARREGERTTLVAGDERYVTPHRGQDRNASKA